MKKVLVVFAVLLVLALISAGAYLLLTDPGLSGEEEQPQSDSSQTDSAVADVDVKRQAKDYTEIQEALDYEILQNRDTVAWLKIEGTDINNSVLQSYDNSYYLRRNERREDDVFGCYFVDYECSVGARDALSINTIIYGHNDVTDDPDGRRFAQLYRFLDPEFAADVPCVQFCTLEEPMEWQIFAVFYTHTYFNYTDVNITDEEMLQIVETAKENSIYDYGVPVEAGDRVLTLSTCTTHFGDENHRFVVMAKLLPADADIPAQVQFTEKTENRY